MKKKFFLLPTIICLLRPFLLEKELGKRTNSNERVKPKRLLSPVGEGGVVCFDSLL